MPEIVEHIERFADPTGCALACWHTWPTEDASRDALKAAGWTLRRQSLFVWVKTTSKGTPAWGMGGYTRCNTEPVHLWTRGKNWPRRVSAGVHEVIHARRQRHSQKPAEARRRLELLYGDIPRIELYARGRVPGWRVWGDQAVE
jgi:N6-adenosine-specific RNA methylase IME4